MPTRDEVTELMCNKFREFLEISYRDFMKFKCSSTLRNLISTLYETSIVVFTYKYGNKKTANYKDVKNNIPNKNCTIIAFVDARDDVTHNLHSVNNLYETIRDYLDSFTKENFNYVASICLGYDIDMYESIVDYCNSEIAKTKQEEKEKTSEHEQKSSLYNAEELSLDIEILK